MGKRTNTAKWMSTQKRWQINVQKDGKRRSFYASTPGRAGQRECNAKADAWLDENITDSNARISNLFDDYVASVKITTSKSNWIKIESFGENWIKPRIGTRKINSLCEQDLQDIINKAHAKGLAKKTLTNLRSVLVAFIKYCRLRKATTLYPESLFIPKSAKVCEKKIMQPTELKKLFTCDETILYGKRVKDIYVNAYRFQVLTGLRPGELIGLCWKDVVGETVYIKRSINSYNETTKGKNENAIRHFNLSHQAMTVLEEQRKVSTSDSIFEIPSLSSYEKRWRRFREANDITEITPYEMRHTFVSVAYELPEGQIKPIVGHSRNMDTFGVYGHEIAGEREKTAEKIGAIFDELLKSVL